MAITPCRPGQFPGGRADPTIFSATATNPRSDNNRAASTTAELVELVAGVAEFPQMPAENPADAGGMSRATRTDFGAEIGAAMPAPSPMAAGMVEDAAAATATAPAGGSGAGVEQLAAPPIDPADAAADTAALIFTLAAGALGSHWDPRQDESDRIVRALERYYRRYGSFDLPPGWALIAAFAMYALPRAKGQFSQIFGLVSGLAGGSADAGDETPAANAPPSILSPLYAADNRRDGDELRDGDLGAAKNAA